MRENTDQNNCEYGQILRSGRFCFHGAIEREYLPKWYENRIRFYNTLCTPTAQGIQTNYHCVAIFLEDKNESIEIT